VLNVFLFVPLGVGLALYGGRGKHALLSTFALSVLIESAQLLIPGRDATIGDVLTNTLGGGIGFVGCRYALVWLRPSPRIAALLVACWCVVWLAIQAISSFVFLPSIPDAKYYGQLARDLGNRAVFRGRVLSAAADELVIPNTAFADSRPIQQSLRNGATIAANVLPAGPTPGVAAIVRVADSEQREIVLLGQDGTSLVFGIRTGASLLRLRPPFFAVPNAFPTGQMGGSALETATVRVTGRYTPRDVGMGAETGAAIHGRNFHPRASLGWTTILPFQWLIEGTAPEAVMSGFWIALLLVPLGYWGARSAQFPRPGPHAWQGAVLVLAGLGILWLGFVLLPHRIGLAGASASDWLLGLVGCLVGVGLARQAGRVAPQPIGSERGA